MITYERAKELFDYDECSGNLIWKKRTSNRIKVGSVAGNLFINGTYRQVSVDGKSYLVHRIVWLINHGYLPSAELTTLTAMERIIELRICER